MSKHRSNSEFNVMKNTDLCEYTDCRTKEGEAVSIIDTINILLRQLYKYRGQFNKQPIKNAIKDLHNNEESYFALSKISFTKDDIENRRVISKVVAELKESGKLIEI